MRNRLTAFILTGMVLGVIVCFATNIWVGGDKALAKDVAGYYHLLADIFLHLIKMIIAPLVFSTLVAGIAHMGDSAALGRIGGRALAWFIIASLISLTLGLIFVNFFAPGEGLNLVRSGPDSGVNTETPNFRALILPVSPTSIVWEKEPNSIPNILVF